MVFQILAQYLDGLNRMISDKIIVNEKHFCLIKIPNGRLVDQTKNRGMILLKSRNDQNKNNNKIFVNLFGFDRIIAKVTSTIA